MIPVYNNDDLAFYIINFDKGHVIVSGDDVIEPVLGYGLNSKLDLENAPSGLKFLLNEYKKEIKVIKKEVKRGNDKIKEKWDRFSSMDYYLPTLKSYSPGNYLLNTMWGGSETYNRDCPYKTSGAPDRCPAGCGAVAITQVLHYWNDRVFPNGSKSYTNSSPNVYLSVDFWNQNYDWASMDLNDADDDNSELIFHSGVAINSNYSDDETTSGSSNIITGLINYFGFNSNIERKYKYANEATWDNLLRAEIDNERPVLYGGCDPDSGTCHLWVVDGYETIYNTYRCNWGFDGPNPNTWYTLTNLSVNGYNFNTSQSAFFNVEPIMDGIPELEGADFICYPDTITFSVNIPSNASVEWSLSNGNLTPIGGSTSTTFQVRATSSLTTGVCTVTATIKNSQGQTFFVKTKDVNVSELPAPEIIGPPTLHCGSGMPYFVDDLSTEYGDSFYWFSDILTITNSNSSECTTACYQSGSGYIACTVTACGVSKTTYKNINVICFHLLVTPNPTSDEAVISIETGEEESMFDNNIEWDMEIYSEAQMLKEKKTKLKGNKVKIKTIGWKEGVYVVRVKYKDELLSNKLIVKK